MQRSYISSYYDLPKREDIKRACNSSSHVLKAVILFMSEWLCKGETLSLTVGDFIRVTDDYHYGWSIDDRLFDFTDSTLIYNFKKANDKLNMGFVGYYRFFSLIV